MHAIEIRHLSKSYKDFTLEDVSLTLPQGCIMGLIGENGAGKSTVIKLILNMIEKDEGTISLFGKDHQDSIHLAKEEIGRRARRSWSAGMSDPYPDRQGDAACISALG